MSEARWNALVVGIALPCTLTWWLLFDLRVTSQTGMAFTPLGVVCVGLTMAAVAAAAKGDKRCLLGLLVFAATLLNYRVRDEAQHDDSTNWQNFVKLAVYICLLAACSPHLGRVRIYVRDSRMQAFAWFIILSILSCMWSVVPALAGVTASCLLIYLLWGIVIADRLPIRLLIIVLVRALAAWIAAAWLYALFDTDGAFLDNRLQGMSGHPNLLGAQVGIFLCLLLGSYSRRYIGKRVFWPLLAVGFITLAASQSRTPAIAIALSALIYRYRNISIVALLSIVAIMMFVIMAGYLEDVQALFIRQGDGDVLAGRTEIWEYLQQKMFDQPWIGYGFNSFEGNVALDFVKNPYGKSDTMATHPHNNYLEVLFSGGVVTVIPFVIWNVLALVRWWRAPDFLRDFYTLFLTIAGFTEVNVPAPAYLGSLVLFIITAADIKGGRT